MLPKELEQARVEIEAHARAYGLDFFTTIFEVLPMDKVSEVAALGGFPTRYPHWRFGMEFDGLFKGHRFGLQRIYEMVINSDPCYAYLMASNPLYDQKTVMAHVYAHCDFFKNNLYFAPTHRKMMDEMANHGARILHYIDRYGLDTVERFLDMSLSLDNLIDPHSLYIRRDPDPEKERAYAAEEAEAGSRAGRLRVEKKYMERYINPAGTAPKEMQAKEEKPPQVPAHPTRDVLHFLIRHAPLKDWQQDILGIVREEAYYFVPQWMTKILNEGWATYWHSRIMTERMLQASELIGYAEHFAGVVATQKGRINPYKLGVELLRDIEERYDKGRFGHAWQQCDDMHARSTWDQKLGIGRQKIFEIRKLYNDVTFIDEFLTPEFCAAQKMFTYGYNTRTERWEIVSRHFEDVKAKLLQSLTNAGQPVIEVSDGNFENRGELLLHHVHDGVDLDGEYARATLENIAKIWSRPVNLATIAQEKPAMFRYDGQQHSIVPG